PSPRGALSTPPNRVMSPARLAAPPSPRSLQSVAWRPNCTRRARNRRNDMSRIMMGVGMLGALTLAASAQPNEPTKVEATTPAAAPATTKVHGRVLAKNGDGVPGAIITAGEATAPADGDGN